MTLKQLDLLLTSISLLHDSRGLNLSILPRLNHLPLELFIFNHPRSLSILVFLLSSLVSKCSDMLFVIVPVSHLFVLLVHGMLHIEVVNNQIKFSFLYVIFSLLPLLVVSVFLIEHVYDLLLLKLNLLS